MRAGHSTGWCPGWILNAIKMELKKHTEAVEEKLEKAVSKIADVCQRINEIEKLQEEIRKKQDLNKQYIDGLLKESLKKEKENEGLLKKLKKNDEEIKRANQVVDDLEQYGRKTMIEVAGY